MILPTLLPWERGSERGVLEHAIREWVTKRLQRKERTEEEEEEEEEEEDDEG